MKIGERPTDEQILSALKRAGSCVATYVVRNWLASRDFGGFDDLTTSHVLYRLRKLERAGKVREAAGPYAVMKSWSLITRDPADD